jgi:hypothetical protein
MRPAVSCASLYLYNHRGRIKQALAPVGRRSSQPQSGASALAQRAAATGALRDAIAAGARAHAASALCPCPCCPLLPLTCAAGWPSGLCHPHQGCPPRLRHAPARPPTRLPPCLPARRQHLAPARRHRRRRGHGRGEAAGAQGAGGAAGSQEAKAAGRRRRRPPPRGQLAARGAAAGWLRPRRRPLPRCALAAARRRAEPGQRHPQRRGQQHRGQPEGQCARRSAGG